MIAKWMCLTLIPQTQVNAPQKSRDVPGRAYHAGRFFRVSLLRRGSPEMAHLCRFPRCTKWVG